MFFHFTYSRNCDQYLLILYNVIFTGSLKLLITWDAEIRYTSLDYKVNFVTRMKILSLIIFKTVIIIPNQYNSVFKAFFCFLTKSYI